MSLATRYRPSKFEDVCAQKSIIKILTRQISTNQIKNTYLFCGASGCGKTTVARIFANAINSGIGTPIEIDGASNNGVDNVKQIVKEASERSISGKYKVYIIDECHALTNQAWQAFLKCIEEPPTYTIFIFCTTDPQKIPATILNRVMRFNFTRIPNKFIEERLTYICNSENFLNYKDACNYISRICKGQMRDAISLLEKCADYDIDLKIDNVLMAIGNQSHDLYFKLTNNIIDGNIVVVTKIIDTLYNEGTDLKLFVDNYLTFILDILKYSICKDIEVTRIPISDKEKLDYAINFENASNYYNYIVDKCLDCKNMIKTDSDIRCTITAMFVQMTRFV